MTDSTAGPDKLPGGGRKLRQKPTDERRRAVVGYNIGFEKTRVQMRQTASVLRGVYVGARRTTLRLEPAIWHALADVAKQRGKSIHDLVTEIAGSNPEPNLSSAVRVFIVEFYRAKATGASVSSAFWLEHSVEE